MMKFYIPGSNVDTRGTQVGKCKAGDENKVFWRARNTRKRVFSNGKADGVCIENAQPLLVCSSNLMITN